MTEPEANNGTSTSSNIMEDGKPTSASTLIADAATLAAQLSTDAALTAQKVLATAVDVAAHEKERQDIAKEELKVSLVDALNQVFGEKQEQQQFINLSKVPLICVQVGKIHNDIAEIKLTLESLKIVKKVVFSVAGLFGTGIVLALSALILKK